MFQDQHPSKEPTFSNLEEEPKTITIEIDDSPSNIESYVSDKPIDIQTRKDIKQSIASRRESTRTIIAKTIVWFFGISLVASILLTATAGINSKVDAKEIGELISKIITPQTPLVTAVLVFYFSREEK